ncbi:MAG: SGNH/GDSL hydrolase family protein [Clostridia bacterium]|nr:SGNH/GDSL hydrolase family protein [Clostridia bacterium]
MGKLKLKYYAIGHSYLKHGPFEGWQTEGFWGMAASRPEKDYFHRLQALLTEHTDCEFVSVAENHAELERLCKPGATKEDYENSPSYRHIRDQLRAFKPNIITVFLDANCVSKEREVLLGFYDSLYGLIAAEKQQNAVVLCLVCFSPVTEEAAKKYGFIPVNVQKIHEKKQQREQNPYYAFRQYPVYEGKIEFRTHPGDEGHEYIAQQIFAKLKDELPQEVAEGDPLDIAAKAVSKGHTSGKWYFDDPGEALDLEIGGFNLRVENSCLQLSAAVDTGLSVGSKKLDLFSRELCIRAAVEGNAQNLQITVFGEQELQLTEELQDAGMHEYRCPLNMRVRGFSIAPDGLDCHIYIDKIVFEEGE